VVSTLASLAHSKGSRLPCEELSCVSKNRYLRPTAGQDLRSLKHYVGELGSGSLGGCNPSQHCHGTPGGDPKSEGLAKPCQIPDQQM
jgi:hypothetical protein